MTLLSCLTITALCCLGCSAGSSSDSADRIDVLFVGNSYTYFNDMPDMVEEIADANAADIETKVVASGGYFLEDHVNDGDAIEALASGKYDVVVIQEQSLAPALPGELDRRTLPAAKKLDAAADAAGVRVIWYQTWGREDGAVDFGFGTYDAMQQALVDGYRQIAQSTGGEVADVGESWQRIRRSGINLGLYDADGSHPSAAGSYAAAIEIAETILGTPVAIAPSVDDVDDETAAAIAAFG